jgi:hypothetical protein
MKNKFLLLLTLILLILLSIMTHLFSNLWNIIIEKQYFIPKESNIFKFEATKMNNGSGDWWLYGEDKCFYYGLNQDNINPRYFKLKKGDENSSFNKHDYNTWHKKSF